MHMAVLTENVQDNNGSASGTSNSDLGQRISGQGKSGGRCAGKINTGTKPK